MCNKIFKLYNDSIFEFFFLKSGFAKRLNKNMKSDRFIFIIYILCYIIIYFDLYLYYLF